MKTNISIGLLCLSLASCVELISLVKVNTRTKLPPEFIVPIDSNGQGKNIHGLYYSWLPPLIPSPHADSTYKAMFFFKNGRVFSSMLKTKRKNVVRNVTRGHNGYWGQYNVEGDTVYVEIYVNNNLDPKYTLQVFLKNHSGGLNRLHCYRRSLESSRFLLSSEECWHKKNLILDPTMTHQVDSILNKK